jgi:hypothetical protein
MSRRKDPKRRGEGSWPLRVCGVCRDSKLCFIRIHCDRESHVKCSSSSAFSWCHHSEGLCSPESTVRLCVRQPTHSCTACTPLKLGGCSLLNRLFAIRHITKKGLKSPSPPPHLVQFCHHHQLISRCVTIVASPESGTSPPESSQPVAARVSQSVVAAAASQT